MQRNFSFLVILISMVVAISTSSYANNWKTYSNAKLGYTLRYPADGALVEAPENISSSFYFDPFAPVTDLTNNPAFAKITVNPKSIVKITFPYHQYLIISTLDHAPQNTPPPSARPILIGKYTFYQQHTVEAGMCKNYDYYTYFLPHAGQYYAFIFLLTTTCEADIDSAAARNKLKQNLRRFENILSTLHISSPETAAINNHHH